MQWLQNCCSAVEKNAITEHSQAPWQSDVNPNELADKQTQ